MGRRGLTSKRGTSTSAESPLSEAVLDAWRINCRATLLLVEGIPAKAWTGALPSAPRRTIRNTVVHLHNTRCSWMRHLAKGSGIALPARLDPRRATRSAAVSALELSGDRILGLLRSGFENGGDFPGVASAFFYGAMPRNAALFCAYALSHEAHHRGQVLVIARCLGHRLSYEVVSGLWQWSSRLRESRAGKVSGSSPAPKRPRRARR